MENKEFYFQIFEDGHALVMVIDHAGNYSQHSSEDATEADGEGAFGPYSWENAQEWTATDRKGAESMLRFSFSDAEVAV